MLDAKDKKELALLRSRVVEPLIRPWSWRFRLGIMLLASLFLAAIAAWAYQIREGLWVTGLNSPVFWGVYLINFVFFIAISKGGTLVSAVLRIVDADWRRPYTRIAETITVTALPFAVTSIFMDLGHPDRMLNLQRSPNFSSPILWDVLCITTYATLSFGYYYMALIPDLAFLRDYFKDKKSWRYPIYRLLALGWSSQKPEIKLHDRIMGWWSIALLTVVVLVHTNVAFIFAMTTKPGWHTGALGPYFVTGAAFQGLAALAVLSFVGKKWLNLDTWLDEKHYNYMGQFLLALLCLWVYFTFAEMLTDFYGGEESHMRVFMSKMTGKDAPYFWATVFFCAILPFPFLVAKALRNPFTVALAGLSINIGMWLERYTIIVPSGTLPYLSWGAGDYVMSPVEWTITIGWIAGFLLFFLLAMRFVPAITVWEIEEGMEEKHASH